MMIWLILFLISLFLMFLFVPKNKIKHFWLAGAISISILYIIDSTLIWMRGFSYSYPTLSGLPIFYLLSAFPAGILLCNYCPRKNFLRLLYVLALSALLLIPEFIIHSIGYMKYLHWNLVRSFIINMLGFSTDLWLSQCLGVFDSPSEQE